MADEWDHQLAPAKLTVSLRVTGVRADGLHLLDAEMVSLDLADELWFAPGDSLEVIRGPGVGDVPAGEENLVCRALRAVGRTAAVRLAKRIPPGGGLGGGSADAAAVLRWAWGLGAGVTGPVAPTSGSVAPTSGSAAPTSGSAARPDLALAATLGADVPFCVVGGRALVRGVGEQVEPLPPKERAFLLLMPPFGVSTARVYAAWDELGGPTVDGPNDLEPAALVVAPRLAAWRDALGEATGLQPVLAGSGSTWFVECEGHMVGHEPLSVAGEVGRLERVRTGPATATPSVS
ncbi:MAG: 4-(cytidine 5'-diphospho)-2-C-methyl-D-erythritol kinase [Acidimicrobiales bacterium]